MKRTFSPYLAIRSSKEVQIDPYWTKVLKEQKEALKRQKEALTLNQKFELCILKANALGAAGFRVVGIRFENDDFQLQTELFKQQEIDAFALKREQMISDHNRALWNEIVKTRAKNGLSNAHLKDPEDLSDEQIEELIQKYNAQSLA